MAMTNNINVWFKKQKEEADVRFKPHGVCQRCGEPLAMSYDTFGLFCRECGWVMK
jgi:ribosomal protein L37E